MGQASRSPVAATVDQRRILHARSATPEALAPFGQLLGVGSGAAPRVTGFYEGAVELRQPVEFRSDEDTCLSLATIHRRPLEVRWMEQHFKHTQTFVPLGGRPFVAVMAPPNGGEVPDLDAVEAFVFDGSAGFTMKIGTWHEFPFALVDNTDVIVILRNETNRDLRSADNGEALGPDVDKKDLQRRFGVTFEVRL